MAGSELPRRRSPRHSGAPPPADAHAENVMPSPAAATPSKPATTPVASEAKENVESRATPSSILKRRRRSILSEVSKVDGAEAKRSEAARKKRKQSLASRRVSFAVESALESVREFQKDERDADGDSSAFPDPSAGAPSLAAENDASRGTAAEISQTDSRTQHASMPKPPAPATTATCPPPGPATQVSKPTDPPASPFGAGPAAAAAEAAMAAFSPAAFSPAATPVSVFTKKTDPFAAFGVSDSPDVPFESEEARAADPSSARASDPRVSSDALARVSNASDFIPLGTPASAAPSSAARSPSGGRGALLSASPAVAPSPGSMFTAHLPRRVTMDPAQYRDAMRAAAEDARDPELADAIIEEEEEEEGEEERPTEEEEEERPTEETRSVTVGDLVSGDGAVTGAVTAAVPGLSALADADEEDFGEDDASAPSGADARLEDAPEGGFGDITAAVPGLSALADADDDADTPGDVSEVLVAEKSEKSSAEKSPAIEGLPMGSVTEDVAANLAAELAAAVAADNEKARAPLPPVPSVPAPPETTEEFAFSAALRESESAEPHSAFGRKSLAKKRRMTLGVRHDSADARIGSEFSPAAAAEFRAEPSPSPFARSGDGDAETETVAEEAAMDLNLSDSFEVPPGAEAAAASVASEGLTTRSDPPTETSEKNSTDAFSEPGTDTLDALARMKADAKEDASLSDPAATAGGDTLGARSVGSIPDAFTQTLTVSSSAFKRATRETTRAPAATPAVPLGSEGLSPYSRDGTVPPATPTPAPDAGSDGDGFTPGQDTLLMMEKLKGRKHGDAVLDSVRRTIGRPSLSAAAWVAATPLPPIGAAMGAAFTPDGAGTIAGGVAGVFGARRDSRAGASSAPFGVRPFGAFGEHTHTSGSPFAPGASQRLALRSAKKANDALALGLLGLPLEAALGADARPVALREFFHACEVSFMDAKNLRRKSLATTSLCAAPAPASVAEAARLVFLTAPVIEALDPMHDHLNDALTRTAGDIEALRGEVEAAQPPLLRLAASRHPAHAAALRDAGKMLKKQCQLAAKEEHAHRRLATERLVASSLHSAKAALEKVRGSLRDSREVAAECAHAADTREVDLKRRIALTGDAATRDAGRMRTREGALLALAERRARVERLRAALADQNAGVVDAQRRRGEAEAEIARAEAALAEARAEAQARGDTEGVLADGGAARRAASAARVRRLAERARRAGDALRVANRIAPWTLEKVGVSAQHGGGAELVASVGRLFRVAVDVGTGAGRITLRGDVDGAGVTPAGGAAFAAAVAGAPRAWSETSPEACGGDVAAVLQRVAPALRRAEGVLAEAEQCRAAFPRITRARCTAGGDLELTFVDLTAERKVTVALTMADGAYPSGALRPRVSVAHAGVFSQQKGGSGFGALPDAAVVEAAIERVPAGEAPRRLFGICRLVDWIVARGESGVADAAREAAAAARAPPPAPAPDVFLGAEGVTLPAVARRGENGENGENGEGAESAEISIPPMSPVSKSKSVPEASRMMRVAEISITPATTAPDAVADVGLLESPVASAPTDSPGSDWGAEAAGEAPASEEKAPAAKTPAGFQKGSNPLFDDSDEET